MTVEPGQTLLHYTLSEKLGEGGMGEVWIAEDSKLNRKVALKILPRSMTGDPERRARFEREAQTVAALSHPNIVTLHSVEEDRGLHFMTMELVDGETLEQRIPRDGFSLSTLLEHAIPLAEAVSAAHDKGITHRDLKPANVMIGKDGRLRVLDFGLAKLHDQARTDGGTTQLPTQSITQDGRIVGTVAYMSPEQAESKPVDARSDVFSLGIMLYEMATGQRPFQGDTTVSTITSIMRDTPAPVTDRNRTLPRHFGRIVRRCLAKDPRRRYQSAVELHNELLELKEEVESGEIEMSTGTQTVVITKRPRWVWALALFAVVAVAAALVGFWPKEETDPDTFQDMTVEALTNDGRTADIAISPDGKYIARLVRTFPAFTRDSIRLRQLDTGTEVEIVSGKHEGMGQLLFTPDGGHVTYLGWHQGVANLYRVSVLGGAPREIAPAVELRGHTFSPDGKNVAFMRQDGDRTTLVVAALDGSSEETTLVTRIQPEEILAPAWSPDGKTVLFVVKRWDPYGHEFRTVAASGGDDRPVGHGDWVQLHNAVWLPDGTGFVAVASDHSTDTGGQIHLFAYPEGTSRRITNDDDAYSNLRLTADGSTLVTTKREWETGIRIASPDEPGKGRYVVPRSSDGPGILGLTWVSTDRLVYATMDGRLWIVSIADGSPVLLTSTANPEVWPAWIPGTERILFRTMRDGVRECWSMDLDGGNRQPLLEGSCLEPKPDARGEWVYFRKKAGSEYHLWRTPIRGGDSEKVDSRNVDGYIPAPDGSRVVVWSSMDLFRSERMEVLNLDDGSVAPWPEPFCLAWRPGTEEATCSNGLWGDLLSRPIDGGEPTRLTQSDGDLVLTHVWSPDGSQLAFSRGVERTDALMIRDFR